MLGLDEGSSYWHCNVSVLSECACQMLGGVLGPPGSAPGHGDSLAGPFFESDTLLFFLQKDSSYSA